MGFEFRHGRRYYYRKRRVGRHVISQYVGNSDRAETTIAIDEFARAESRLRRAQLGRMRAAQKEAEQQARALSGLVDALIKSQLTEAGFWRHKGTWRKKRQRK